MHIDPIFYHATPALLILVAAETVYRAIHHRHDNKDMLSSLALVLGRLPLSAFAYGIVLYLYTWIYQYRIFTLHASQWWVWAVCFFFDDFSFYWFHRLSHQIRFLWASHQVHHSSEKFTLASGLRVPWTSELTGNFLFWAWMPLVGIEPYMVIIMKSVGALYQFWLHTETIKKLPYWVETVFNTPSHHRVHHSSNVEYLDKNHGGTLIIWDKIFGTFQPELSVPKYGLTAGIKSFNPLVIAFHEWKSMVKDLSKSHRMKDRLHYLFNAPGWSHDGSGRTARQLQSGLKEAQIRSSSAAVATEFPSEKT